MEARSGYRRLFGCILAVLLLFSGSWARSAEPSAVPRLQSGSDGLSMAVAVSPGGRIAALSRFGGLVSLVDLATLQEVDSFRVGSFPLVGMAYASDELLVAIEQWSQGDSARERVYAIDSARGEITLLTSHEGVSRMAVSQGVLFLGIGTELQIWELARHKLGSRAQSAAAIAALAPAANGGAYVVTVDRVISTADAKGVLRKLGSLRTPPPYSAFAVSPDGTKAAAASGAIPGFILEDGVEILDVRGGTSSQLAVRGMAASLLFSPDASHLSIGTGNGIRKASNFFEMLVSDANGVSEWDLSTSKRTRWVSLPAQAFATVPIPGLLKRFVTATWGSGSFIVNLERETTDRIFAPPNVAKAMRFTSPQHLHVVGEDGSHQLWDTHLGILARHMAGPSDLRPGHFVTAFAGARSAGTVEWQRSDDACTVRIRHTRDFGPVRTLCIAASTLQEAAPAREGEELWVPMRIEAAANSGGDQLLIAVSLGRLHEGMLGRSSAGVLLVPLGGGAATRVLTRTGPVIHQVRFSRDESLMVAALGDDFKIASAPSGDRPEVTNIATFRVADGAPFWSLKYELRSDPVDLALEGRLLTVGTGEGLFGTMPGESWVRFASHSRASAMALAPLSRLMFVGSHGGEFSVVDPSASYTRRNAVLAGRVVAATISDNEVHVAAATDDGAVHLLDARTLRAVGSFTAWPDAEWLAMTAERAFSGSDAATRRTYLRYEGKAYRLDQIYDSFFRPDLVSEIFQERRVLNPLLLDFQEALRLPPPRVSRYVLRPGPRPKELLLDIALTDQGGGVGPTRVYVNGRLAWTNGGFAGVRKHALARPVNAIPRALPTTTDVGGEVPVVTIAPTPQPVAIDFPATFTVPIHATAGKVEVAIVAQNRAGTVQSVPAVTQATLAGSDPPARIFVLAAGVRSFELGVLDLEYSVKDASDFAEAISKLVSPAFGDARVILKPLENPKVGALVEELQKLSTEAEPQDILVFFVSTHGMPTADGLALLGSDYDGKTPGKGQLLVHELLGRLLQVPAQQQVVIVDACYAGQVEQSLARVYDDRMRNLAKLGGVHVVSATQSLDVAREGVRGERNGHLTHALLEVIRQRAPSSVQELATSAIESINSGWQPGGQTARYWRYGADIRWTTRGSLR